MRKFNASFPHPILGISDDISGDFSAVAEVQVRSDFCTITAKFHTDNEYFQELVNSGQASFVIELNCTRTVYREFFKTGNINEEYIFHVPTSQVNAKVDVYFYICSNGSFTYESETFNADYSGYSFKVSSGDILAYKGQTYFFVDKYDPVLKKSSSIITLIRDEETDRVKYEYSDNKIAIHLPHELFDFYRRTNTEYAGIYYSTFAYPAILGALYKYSNGDPEEVQDLKWGVAIHEKIQRDSALRMKVESGDIESLMNAAQSILKLPYNSTFDSLKRMDERFAQSDNEYDQE